MLFIVANFRVNYCRRLFLFAGIFIFCYRHSTNLLLICDEQKKQCNLYPVQIFTRIAISLFKTEESMAIPCSVKAKGIFRTPPQLEVTICDFKFSISFLVNWNIKSAGNLSGFLFTA